MVKTLQYDSAEDAVKIDVSDAAIGCLKAYAIEVLKLMQEKEPEYANCWTTCVITFEGIAPEFSWSSADDAYETADSIRVDVPVSG